MVERENAATPAAYTPPQPVSLEAKPIERSILLDAARRFARNRLAMFGLFIIACLLFVAIFADVITPYRYDEADFTVANELPFIDAHHILGADAIGRDYLTRLIYGARTSMIVGLSVPLIAFGIGVTLGAMSGYFGGPLAIFAEAGLSFRGIGITGLTASWGKMVGSQRGTSLRVYYHLALFPTILVALTMLGFSFVGDGLQEALDPGRIR